MTQGFPHEWCRVAFAAWLAFAGAAASSGGCTGSGKCESSRCAAGNACIDDGSGSGETCHKVCTAQSDCPFGWYCNDGELGSQAKNWCVQNTNFSPMATGQWSTSCSPSGGEGANPACDWNDAFACYGMSPTDANAFCTLYSCAQDSDCKGGWWCATQNVGPNVTSANPTYGPTRQLCLPRRYCAPCQTDHDCAQDQTPQHCAADAEGRGYCTPQCSGNAECQIDATCAAPWAICTPGAGQACKTDDDCPPTAGTFQHCDGGQCTPECASSSGCGVGQTCAPTTFKVCVPRAGICVGDGGFCSPCRSDADCTDGYCFSGAPYSPERFCTAKASVASCAPTMANGNPIGCPVPTSANNWRDVGCLKDPADQCVALVTFGTSTGQQELDPGCWTPNR